MSNLSVSSELRTAVPSVPVIGDRQSGDELISRIALDDAPQAQFDLCRVLDGLHAAPPDGETYFRLLERIRVPVAVVAEKLASAYLNQPLPLAELEEDIFQRSVALWIKTAHAYAHCAENDAPGNDDAGLAQRIALILHRCLHHTGQAIVEHQRARRELPAGLWRELHGYYASAEEWGVATLEIPGLVAGGRTDCASAYLAFILGEMAGCYSLSVGEQALVRRWAVAWSPLVSLHRVEDSSPQGVVDLMQDAALRPVAGGHLRRLDTSRLARQISLTREQLQQKIAPLMLGLGDDCTPQQCLRLLDRLSGPWSQARAPRQFRRHASSASTRVCSGFGDIHYFISGHEFEQPDCVRSDSRQLQQLRPKALAHHLDRWQVANTSANGFRLLRSAAGREIAHGQLLALRPHDGERFVLAQATWLRQEKNGGLIAGIRMLPGIPAAIAARRVDAGEGIFQRAFLLPAVAALAAEQSLVIPPGWFACGREIELHTDGRRRVRLRELLDDGPDFARVSFAVC
ncbi:MAG: hypothetical protein H6R17_856 [Proteobacteria bacterium]|nr:hypothetical protein [Pseudomonadota bacterium]